MSETVRTWRLLRSLRRGTRRPPESTARLQARLLRAALDHAYEHVPLYRRRWDEAGVDPGTVRGPEDIGRIPPVSEPELREAVERGELIAPEPLAAFPTSGSTGRALWVPRGRIEQRVWRAAALRIWFEHGYRWRHATVHFVDRPGPSHLLQRLGISRTAWISTELELGEQVERYARAGPHVVVGTPTVLRRIAAAIADAGIEVARPRIVFCQGELLDSGTGRLLERVLGSPPIGLYGLTEVGLVAWQCERREGYHLNADTCLVEVLRAGRPASPGEVGTVVVTDLRGRTMPLIRYETGDLAVAGDGPCPCGRTLPLLGSLEGRRRDAVTLPDGRLMTTRALVEHMAGVLPPDRYRLRQETPTRFRLHLEAPAREGSDAIATHLLGLLGEVELHAVAGPPAGTGPPHKSYPLSSALTASPLGTPA